MKASSITLNDSKNSSKKNWSRGVGYLCLGLFTLTLSQNLTAKNSLDYRQISSISEIEFYKQSSLLFSAIDNLQTGKVGRTDWYLLGVAGFADQNVFKNEINFVTEWFDKSIGDEQHSIALINNRRTWSKSPIATRTSIKRSLNAIGETMNTEEDVLFLAMTSHGRVGKFSLTNEPVRLSDIDPRWLRKTLDNANIKWRVLVVSACHSGSFVDALKSPYTLILTAASTERTSFGCGNDSIYTYFGREFFINGLPTQSSFLSAFDAAREQVAIRENEMGFPHSQPQMYIGNKMREKLPKLESVLFHH